jgi:NTP pyrophosphatase (non-canonical NTP hydrolase)
MDLNEYSELCHDASRIAGWWEGQDQYFIATKFALIHSEVSEAFEGYRKNKVDDHLLNRLSVEVELADALHRIFDLAGALGLDLEGALREKMAYNAQRADHKKEAREAPGGKRF